MLRIEGDISKEMQDLQRRVLVALKASVAGATEHAKQTMRARIRERSSSPRLPNIIGSAVYPRSAAQLSYGPSGSIFPRGSKAALILEQMASGATISAKGGKALAIPLHNQRGAGGTLLRPKDFPHLQFIPAKKGSGRTIGVLAIASGRRARGGLLTAKSRRMQGAASRARVQSSLGEDWIAMFVLVRTVRIPRVFDPDVILQEAVAQIPALFDAAFEGA